jgi:hypothetical protein
MKLEDFFLGLDRAFAAKLAATVGHDEGLFENKAARNATPSAQLTTSKRKGRPWTTMTTRKEPGGTFGSAWCCWGSLSVLWLRGTTAADTITLNVASALLNPKRGIATDLADEPG